MAFSHEKIFRELKESHPRSHVDVAFKTIYLHTFSYASTGTAFKRLYKRAHIPVFRFDSFIEVKKWIFENKDFRELMTVYNKPEFLLYFNPPYLEGEKLIGSV